MQRLKEILRHSVTIVTKKHLRYTRRMSLLISYWLLVLKRFLIRFGVVDASTASFVGYKIKVGLFGDFYWTFIEIFIDEDYYFETENRTPYIIDCGGNIGIATLYFKWLYPNAVVDIYEIEPENIEILKHNLETNNLKDVQVIQKAVANKTGEFSFFGGRRAGTISKALIDEQVKKDDTYAASKVTVEMTKLSTHLDKTVDFLKMDIEGAESDVFEDLRDSGKLRNIEKTTIEFHRFSSDENKLSTIMDALEQFDFDVIFPNNFSKLTDIKRSYYNYMIRAGQRKWKQHE